MFIGNQYKRRRDKKPKTFPRKCIFCGRSPVTGEHIWPEWMHEYLPKLPDPMKEEVYISIAHYDTILQEKRPKPQQGHVYTKQIYVVCKKCNEVWMGKIETDAAAILIPMLRGLPVTLSENNLRRLMNWITLKLFVIEASHPAETVTTERDRTAFWRNRTIPTSLQCWIGLHNTLPWYTSYRVQSGRFSVPGRQPPVGNRRNVESVALGVGHLLIFCLCNTNSDFDLGFDFNNLGFAQQIWPRRSEIVAWPKTGLLDSGLGVVVSSLELLVRSGRVQWVG